MKTCKLFISFSNINGVNLIPTQNYSLDTNDIILYTVYLPNFLGLKSSLLKFLNSKELNRADRFHKELDRNRFIIYRSILKFVLAAHTKIDVKNIYLDYYFNKKPYIASHPELCFNISHSHDFAVIAVSHRQIGIDIEYMTQNFNFTNLIPDIFADDEILIVQNAVDKKNAFYTSWTRKEALVKALGKGIDEDFKYIPCLDGEHNIDSNMLKSTKNWQVYSFELADNYLGAVAFDGLPTISKKLEFFIIPNTIKDLLEMTLVKNE